MSDTAALSGGVTSFRPRQCTASLHSPVDFLTGHMGLLIPQIKCCSFAMASKKGHAITLSYIVQIEVLKKQYFDTYKLKLDLKDK